MSDERQDREAEILRDGWVFGQPKFRPVQGRLMEAMSYDLPMPVSPRDPAGEWRSIVEEHDWTPTPAAPDAAFAEAFRKAFPECPAAVAVLAGVSLYVTLARYDGAGSKRSA
jgi:hypothetical protein